MRAFADEQSAGDLVVSSAYARSGVLLLRRSAEHGGPLYREIGRGLLQHDISCCCLLGSTSFGAGRSAMSTALASFLWHSRNRLAVMLLRATCKCVHALLSRLVSSSSSSNALIHAQCNAVMHAESNE